MIRLLIEVIIAVVIIAVVSDAELRAQSIDLMYKLFEFIGQSATITYNHGKDFLEHIK